MSQPTEVIVRPNFLKLLGMMVVANAVIGGGLLMIFGVTTILYMLCALVIGLSAALFIVAVIRQVPKVVITREGFTFYKAIGRESHQWSDIEGQFAVVSRGFTGAVAYCLTDEYKARTGRKPLKHLFGFDGAIMGSFELTSLELANVLDVHKDQGLQPG